MCSDELEGRHPISRELGLSVDPTIYVLGPCNR